MSQMPFNAEAYYQYIAFNLFAKLGDRALNIALAAKGEAEEKSDQHEIWQGICASLQILESQAEADHFNTLSRAN